MDIEKNNKLIFWCWFLFGSSLIISIVTKFEACPFKNCSSFSFKIFWSYMHEISIGVTCSAILVLFVEIYHINENKKRVQKNRIIFVHNLKQRIEYLEEFVRSINCTIKFYFPEMFEKTNVDGLNGFQMSGIVESMYLNKFRGKYCNEDWWIIFLTAEEFNEMRKHTSGNADDTAAFELALRYRRTIEELNKIYETIDVMNITILKQVEIIEEPEFEVIYELFTTLKELRNTINETRNNGKDQIIIAIRKYNKSIEKSGELYCLLNEYEQANKLATTV